MYCLRYVTCVVSFQRADAAEYYMASTNNMIAVVLVLLCTVVSFALALSYSCVENAIDLKL